MRNKVWSTRSIWQCYKSPTHGSNFSRWFRPRARAKDNNPVRRSRQAWSELPGSWGRLLRETIGISMLWRFMTLSMRRRLWNSIKMLFWAIGGQSMRLLFGKRNWREKSITYYLIDPDFWIELTISSLKSSIRIITEEII